MTTQLDDKRHVQPLLAQALNLEWPSLRPLPGRPGSDSDYKSSVLEIPAVAAVAGEFDEDGVLLPPAEEDRIPAEHEAMCNDCDNTNKQMPNHGWCVHGKKKQFVPAKPRPRCRGCRLPPWCALRKVAVNANYRTLTGQHFTMMSNPCYHPVTPQEPAESDEYLRSIWNVLTA